MTVRIRHAERLLQIHAFLRMNLLIEFIGISILLLVHGLLSYNLLKY